MKKLEIINALKKGNYAITIENDCGCIIEWEIMNGNITHERSSFDACWVGIILKINGNEEPIAESIYGESFNILVNDIEKSDIPEEIIDEMHTGNDWPENDTHDAKVKKGLVDFLEEQITEGAKLYRDNLRGFANEYTCIFVQANSDAEINQDWDELSSEEWASEFLYKGDDATQAYNSHEVI